MAPCGSSHLICYLDKMVVADKMAWVEIPKKSILIK